MAMTQIWALCLCDPSRPHPRILPAKKRRAGGKAGDPEEKLDWAAALTNGAMMNIPPSELKRLPWWEYQALLWNWGERHNPETEEEVEAPDADFVARRHQLLARSRNFKDAQLMAEVVDSIIAELIARDNGYIATFDKATAAHGRFKASIDKLKVGTFDLAAEGQKYKAGVSGMARPRSRRPRMRATRSLFPMPIGRGGCREGGCKAKADAKRRRARVRCR
jgi:hypothetical protein